MRFERRLKPIAGVNLIPMIDVVFQLVTFFMLSSTFIQTPGIALELPASTSAEPVVMSRMVVTVLPDGRLFLNSSEYTLEGLGKALEDLSQEERDSFEQVVVEADGEVSYRLMVRVLDVLRLNGFSGVTLRTREEVP